ncbi:MAG: transposase, partial [Clostridia bacterium]|nr:transposase [Clostridia bacterium]
AVVTLTEIGQTVERYLRNIGDVNADVYADTYIIMPDHVHLLLRVCGYVSTKEDGWSPAVHTRMVRVIRSFKTVVTKKLGFSIWQTSFYDRVVREKNEYMAYRRYILENPARWLAKYGGIP